MSEREKHRQTAARALGSLVRQIRWKPHKAEQHLARRKGFGHLSDQAKIEDYNAVISAVLNARQSLVYHYSFGARDYYAVSGDFDGVSWLIIFTASGILETAFPPDDLADYLATRGFGLLGSIEELVP